MIDTLIDDWSPLAVAAKVMWVAQLVLIVHALKTGRPYWWIFVLLWAPVIGGIAYLLIELAPEMRGSGMTVGWKPRAWRIRALRAELEETDTVKLRLALAEELLAAGQAEEARQAAEECLQGVFRDDPHTLAAVARYRLECGQASAALEAIQRINTRADRMLAQDVALLRGRALLLTGQHSEAQTALRSIAQAYIGEEARYFLALSLKESGSIAEARELWMDIRKRFRRAGRGWRRSEKRWFKFAGERLSETQGT